MWPDEKKKKNAINQKAQLDNWLILIFQTNSCAWKVYDQSHVCVCVWYVVSKWNETFVDKREDEFASVSRRRMCPMSNIGQSDWPSEIVVTRTYARWFGKQRTSDFRTIKKQNVFFYWHQSTIYISAAAILSGLSTSCTFDGKCACVRVLRVLLVLWLFWKLCVCVWLANTKHFLRTISECWRQKFSVRASRLASVLKRSRQFRLVIHDVTTMVMWARCTWPNVGRVRHRARQVIESYCCGVTPNYLHWQSLKKIRRIAS